MRKLVLREETEIIQWPEDVAYLKTKMLELGFEVDDQTIRVAWERHSQEMCAGWLGVGPYMNAQTVYNCLSPHLREV